MIIGYARCSTREQNLDRQLDALKKAGCERIFEEKKTGTVKNRPELEHLFDVLHPGDTIIVTELARLSRSTKDIFSLVEEVHARGADIRSLKEAWLDTTTPTGKFLFTIVAGVSQFERDMIVERTKEGLAAARARGRLGGRPKVDPKSVAQAIAMYKAGNIPINDILKTTGLGRATFYKYLNQEKSEKMA